MQTKIYNQTGRETGTVELAETVFGLPAKADLVHQARVAMLANQRRPVAHTKDRGEVRGGGHKPWRQKGTGRARHGSRRSPIWKGGGVTHGPSKEKKYSQKINAGMSRQALRVVLSSKFKQDRLKVLDSLSLSSAKTKDFLKTWQSLEALWPAARSVLFVWDKIDANLIKTTANLPRFKFVLARELNLLDVLRFGLVILNEKAVKYFNK